MSQRSVALKFGPGSLTRDNCPKCAEVTLHKSGECIHCHHKLFELKPGDVNDAIKSPFTIKPHAKKSTFGSLQNWKRNDCG